MAKPQRYRRPPSYWREKARGVGELVKIEIHTGGTLDNIYWDARYAARFAALSLGQRSANIGIKPRRTP